MNEGLFVCNWVTDRPGSSMNEEEVLSVCERGTDRSSSSIHHPWTKDGLPVCDRPTGPPGSSSRTEAGAVCMRPTDRPAGVSVQWTRTALGSSAAAAAEEARDGQKKCRNWAMSAASTRALFHDVRCSVASWQKERARDRERERELEETSKHKTRGAAKEEEENSEEALVVVAQIVRVSSYRNFVFEGGFFYNCCTLIFSNHIWSFLLFASKKFCVCSCGV
jgi:hypothetical protein